MSIQRSHPGAYSRSSRWSALLYALSHEWFTYRLVYRSTIRARTKRTSFVARRLASLPHSGIFFRRAILLQANCFLLVYVAISWRAQERTPASGPNRSPVHQRSNALKRLPNSLTIVYHLLYCTDPPTGVQTNTAITTVISAAVRTYTARPSRLCGWSRWSMLTRWSCLWSRS